MAFRPLYCLFLSGCLRQVSLYIVNVLIITFTVSFNIFVTRIFIHKMFVIKAGPKRSNTPVISHSTSTYRFDLVIAELVSKANDTMTYVSLQCWVGFMKIYPKEFFIVTSGAIEWLPQCRAWSSLIAVL